MTENKGNAKILKPKISSDLALFDISIENISDYSSISTALFKDIYLENIEAKHVCFNETIFRNVKFTDVSLQNIELTDVRFENCDLSNVDFSGAIIHRAEFINCKLMGINLRDATLQNIYILQCNGKFALMSFTQMKRVIFEESIFENSNFQNSNFTKVQFKKCNFRLSQMSGTSLSGIDLSDSNVEGLGIQLEDLKGAIVSPMQAVDFSKLLGLVINV
jgi:uncharacterized protein YjbI with pentapeptide repeats